MVAPVATGMDGWYENSPGSPHIVLPAKAGIHGAGGRGRVRLTCTTPNRQATPHFHHLVRPYRGHSDSERSRRIYARLTETPVRRPGTSASLTVKSRPPPDRQWRNTRPASKTARWSVIHPPAGYVDGLARDVSGPIRHEERRHLGDVLRCLLPVHRRRLGKPSQKHVPPG